MSHSILIRSSLFALSLGMLVLAGCQKPETPKPEEPKGEIVAKPEAKPIAKAEGPSVQEILERMATAYAKAQAYADAGTVRLLVESGGQKIIDETANYSFTLERPNKARLQAYDAMLVCNGVKFYGAIESQPGVVLERDAPKQLTLQNLYADRVLAMALTQNFAGATPQVMLLLGKDPLKALVREGETPTLDEPGEIGDRKCYRLQFKRPEGATTLWIDQESSILRRVVLPTDELRQYINQQQPVDRISLVADFTGAQFEEHVDPKAFAFDVPKDAEIVKYFLPAEIAFIQLLGKKAPDFRFTDPEGNPVTPQTVAEKVTVLDFWATWCPPCKKGLPFLQSVYEKYKDNPKVAFYAVSVDQPSVDNKDVAKVLEGLKVTLPFLRDKDQTAAGFKFQGIPMTFILGPDGVVQFAENGVNPKATEEISEKIEKLLAGENLYESILKEYRDKLSQYEKMVDASFEGSVSSDGGDAVVEEREIPAAKIAERTEPAKLKLTSAWKCDALKSPGNLLVVADKGSPAKILAVENWKSIVELGLDGKVIAKHDLNLAEDELIGNIRSAVGADGKRYYVAFLAWQQRCHVLDDKWEPVASYPADALKQPHSGISDVEIGDLNGDGVLKLYLSHSGAVGVQCVSLDGKRLWANRLFSNAINMAFGEPNDKGQSDLYCTDSSGAVVVLNAEGERQEDIRFPEQVVQWIKAADLLGDGHLSWCGLVTPQIGENHAVGLSLKGEILWDYALPVGVNQQPIEPAIAGRVVREGPGQWIFPGPDGSIHILAADGTLIEKFNYGEPVTGLATIEIDGQPAIVVATEKTVEAFKVE